MRRIPYSELEWHDKPVGEMDRQELLHLVETLHGLVLQSAANFDQLCETHNAMLEARSLPYGQRRH